MICIFMCLDVMHLLVLLLQVGNLLEEFLVGEGLIHLLPLLTLEVLLGGRGGSFLHGRFS